MATLIFIDIVLLDFCLNSMSELSESYLVVNYNAKYTRGDFRGGKKDDH